MVDKVTDSSDQDRAERKHEPDSTWTGWIAVIGGGLLLLVILVLFGISIAFKTLIPRQPLVGAGEEWTRQHAAPGVEPNQAYGRERLLAEEEDFLRQYAWEDKHQGIARIPIERGIAIMAARKLNIDWPANGANDSTDKEPE